MNCRSIKVILTAVGTMSLGAGVLAGLNLIAYPTVSLAKSQQHTHNKRHNMEIYDLIKQDHDEVKKTLTILDQGRNDELAKNLGIEVYAHNEAEEDTFYKPLKRRAGKLKIIVDVGNDEHEGVNKMFDKLQNVSSDDEWKLLFTTIKKSLEDHISVEEDVIFTMAKQHFSSEEAKQMAVDMQTAKEKFKKQKK